MRWISFRLLLMTLIMLGCRPVLKAQLKEKHTLEDSTRVLTLLQESYLEKDEALRILKVREAYLIAKSISYQPGVIVALSHLISLHKARHENVEAIRYAFSLIPLLEKDPSPQLFKLYIICAELLQEEQVTGKALEYYTKAWQMNRTPEVIDKIIQLGLLNQDYASVIESCREKSTFPLEPRENAGNQLQMAYAAQMLQQDKEAETYYMGAYTYSQANNLKAEASLACNNLGYLYFHSARYTEAIRIYETALTNPLSEAQMLRVLSNLAIALQNTGNPSRSLDYLRRALQFCKTPKDEAEVNRLMAASYLLTGDTYNAMHYNQKAGEASARAKDMATRAEVYLMQALIEQKLYDFENAFESYKNYLRINDSLLNTLLIQKQDAVSVRNAYDKSEKELRELALNDQIKYLNIQQLQLEKDKLELEAQNRNKEIARLLLEQKNKQQQLKLIESEAEKARQELAAQVMNQKIESLKQKELLQKNELEQAKAEEKSRLQEISLLEQQDKINKLKLEKEASFKENTYRYALLGLVLLLAISTGLLMVRRKNKVLAQQNTKIENQFTEIQQQRNIIAEEKAKSEQLLLNILPAEVAHELKEKGEATPMQYEMVSVLFTDLVNFTRYAEAIDHNTLVAQLNTLFLAFDEIIHKHNMEKIKTIGDSYMCAGGLPLPNKTNAHDAVNAAMDMLAYIETFNANATFKLEMRIGINTGRVVAGVIGKSRFAYDIWGDDVNIAARMEQAGAPGRINISGNTYRYIQHEFQCTFRGMIEAKNKGKVEMYFVDGRKNASLAQA